jgi:hypothetical protein
MSLLLPRNLFSREFIGVLVMDKVENGLIMAGAKILQLQKLANVVKSQSIVADARHPVGI